MSRSEHPSRHSFPPASKRPRSINRRRKAGLAHLIGYERLEERLNLSAYTVNVLGDASGSASGTSTGTYSGDLRYCLSQAIADQQTDTITFDPSVFTNAADLTITLSAALANTSNAYGATAFVLSGGDNITIDGVAVPGLTIDGGDAERLFAASGGRIADA